MDQVELAFERQLAQQRLGNARHLARFRLLAISAFLLLSLALRVALPGWIGPVELLAVYWLAAAALFWGSRRWQSVARLSGWSLSFLDMPMILVLLWTNMSALESAGAVEDARALRLAAAVFYVMFVMLASLSLSPAQIYLAGAVAALCEVALIYHGGADVTFLLIMPLCMALAALVGSYASRRVVELVRVVSAEGLKRERLGRYFSPQVAEHIERSAGGLSTGETREVTILFCDIRGFTALSERMSGAQVVALLNDFHTRMVDTVFAHGGTLDKLMGDGLMAYFGAPVDQPDHATRAVRCALAMQAQLEAMSAERTAGGAAPLRMGVGVHTGEVVLGDIGAPRRRDFTAVGDAVNVAARIEQLTKETGETGVSILVSEQTRRAIGDAIRFSEPASLPIQGKAGQFLCYAPIC